MNVTRGGTALTWAVASAIALAALASVPSAPGPAPSAASPPLPAAVPSPPAPGVGSIVVAPGFVAPRDSELTGGVPAGTVLSAEVGLAQSDPSGFANRVASEYVPGSPNFQRFLSPSAVATDYGATPASLDAAVAYFAGFGLTSVPDPEHLLLTVSGSSVELGRAFGVSFDEYRLADGSLVYSHAGPASLPARLGVTGVLGLGDTSPIRPDVAATSPPTRITPASGCTGSLGQYTPCQILGAYNITPLLANGSNGGGERLAVVDAYSSSEPEGLLANDLSAFSADFSPTIGPTEFLYPVPTSVDLNQSGTNPEWSLEDALDLEWAHATAPGATVEMTFSPDSSVGLYEAVDWLVGRAAADVISLSWGEQDVGVYNAYSTPCVSACNASTDGTYGLLAPVLEAAAAEGIGVFAASGDCGASDGTSGVATNYPASDPYVTGVGATDLLVGSNGSYAGEVAWSGNSTGAHSPGCQNQGGSGGGYAPFPRPWWQTGLPTTPATRGVPDVSLDGGYPVAIVLDGQTVGVVGTSVATPVWAGIASIADQQHGSALGFLDPGLYAAAADHAATDFHDVTSGGNGYPATVGWDPVTGIGSPNVAALVVDLAGHRPVTSARPSVVLYGSPRFGPAPLTVHFQLVASGGDAPYPLEEVVFGDGNSTRAMNGSAVHTYPRAGVYAASAFVVDSRSNDSISAPLAVVVGGGHPLTVSLAASVASPAVGEVVNFTVNATGGRAPYFFDYSFGDGTYLLHAAGTGTAHSYGSGGGYCVAVVAWDSGSVVSGGQSFRLAVAAGGAPAPNCANDSSPLVISANPNPGLRDAPADFPGLFNYSGGARGAGAARTSIAYTSTDGYLNACGCTIVQNPGVYPVTAWVNDSVGQEASASTTLEVTPPLVGTFAASTLSGPVPLHVYLFAKASGGYFASANDTVWTLGDGREYVGAALNVTYVVPGEYVAEGHLEDGAHGNASEAFLIDVLPASGPVAVGVAGSIRPAMDVSSGTVVTFSGSAVGPNTNALNVTLDWAFGNGESGFGSPVTQSMFGPLPAADANVFHGTIRVMFYDAEVWDVFNYSLPNFYAVEPGGFLDSAMEVSVNGSLSVTTGLAPVHLLVRGNVSAPGGGTMSWSFDDGSTALGSYVEHTLYAEGPYNIEPTVSDNFGDRAWVNLAVVVNGSLQVFGGPSPSIGAPTLFVQFRVSAQEGSGPPYSFRWYLPNGTQFNGTAFNVSLSALGTYAATVSVTDRAGHVTNKTFTVSVVAPGLLSPPVILILGAGGGAGITAASYRVYAAYAKGRRPFNPSQRREDEAWRRAW